MAYQRWTFKSRGDQACGEVQAEDYVLAFMAQYNSTISFDGQTRIAYFFDQGTVIENGGTESSVLIGSYEKTQQFYDLSQIGGNPTGGELLNFDKGSKKIYAVLFPAGSPPLLKNTFITGSIVSTLTNAADVETLFGFPTGTVTQYAQTAVDSIEYNINANYTIGALSFNNNSSIETINDADGWVISIGFKAFFGAQNLTSALFKNVTTLDNSAFEGASLLQIINLDSAEILWDYVFSGCESIGKLALPSCTRLGNMCFSGNTSLTDLVLPLVNQLGDNVFDNCPNLTKITLPSLSICPMYAFGGWGGPGYTLTVPSAMVGNVGVMQAQSGGTSVVLI